jgi:intein-encoded DNA endonuclease-like protein
MKQAWNSNHFHPAYASWHQKLISRNSINNPMRKKIPSSGKTLTSKLAYILGALKGDGSLVLDNKTSFRLSLAVNDFEFAQKFKQCGEEQFKLKGHYKIVQDKWHKKPRHQIHFHSKDLGFLKGFDLNSILHSSNEIKKEFINGFIDSEAGVYPDFKKSSYHIEIYNKNILLLKFCQKVLENYGIQSKLYIDKRGYGRICVLRKRDFIIFSKTFEFSIPRKQERIEEVIEHWNKMDNSINYIDVIS